MFSNYRTKVLLEVQGGFLDRCNLANLTEANKQLVHFSEFKTHLGLILCTLTLAMFRQLFTVRKRGFVLGLDDLTASW